MVATAISSPPERRRLHRRHAVLRQARAHHQRQWRRALGRSDRLQRLGRSNGSRRPRRHRTIGRAVHHGRARQPDQATPGGAQGLLAPGQERRPADELRRQRPDHRAQRHHPEQRLPSPERYNYDGAGVLTLAALARARRHPPDVNIYDQTRSYPAVDEKISVVNRHIGISQVSNEDFPGRHQVYQENWYDALGDGCSYEPGSHRQLQRRHARRGGLQELHRAHQLGRRPDPH
jgi:hypothetical protein